MKRFEFRLRRVLDLRRQQAGVERAQLENLIALAKRLEQEKASIHRQIEEARAHVKHGPSAAGDDLVALAHYERHMWRRNGAVDQQLQQAAVQITQQQAKVREAERKVKLLEMLESRRRAEWNSEHNKELEALAADSYLARILSERREAESETLL